MCVVCTPPRVSHMPRLRSCAEALRRLCKVDGKLELEAHEGGVLSQDLLSLSTRGQSSRACRNGDCVEDSIKMKKNASNC